MLYWLATWTIMPFARRRISRVVGFENLPAEGPMILIANHVSWVDPILIGSCIRKRTKGLVRFVAASGKYKALGGLAIDRRVPGAVLTEALARLRRGETVAIFPNGNVPHSGEGETHCTGAARLALWSGAPVIPIGIRGVSAHSLLRSVRALCTSRNIELHIGPPLQFPAYGTDRIPQDYLSRVAETLRERINQLI